MSGQQLVVHLDHDLGVLGAMPCGCEEDECEDAAAVAGLVLMLGRVCAGCRRHATPRAHVPEACAWTRQHAAYRHGERIVEGAD